MPEKEKKEDTKKKTKIGKKGKKILIPFLLILALIFFAVGYKFKGLVLVANVAGKPVYSWTFFKQLYQNYGPLALEDITMKILIEEKAKENGIEISQEELDKEIKNLTENLGGEKALKEILSSQQTSLSEFEKNVRLQLLVEKIIEKNVSVTNREIEAFILQNEAQLQATDEAKRKQEAKQILEDQKFSEKYQTFFTELKNSKDVQQFIEF